MSKTKATKASQIKRKWHLLNADGWVLGRMASQVAQLLIGKHKPNYAPYLDNGDFVVVTNASTVKVTGKKKDQKIYYRHSGYPGGFKEINLSQQLKKDPRKVIRHAVGGMLPKNKHRDQRLSRLKIFAGSEHQFEDKFKQKKK